MLTFIGNPNAAQFKWHDLDLVRGKAMSEDEKLAKTKSNLYALLGMV